MKDTASLPMVKESAGASRDIQKKVTKHMTSILTLLGISQSLQ